MNILQLSNWLKKIGMNQECIGVVENYSFPCKLYPEYKALFWTDIDQCYECLLAMPDSYYYILSFYTQIAFEFLFDDGKGSKIVQNGYYEDGCRDIILWAEDCKRQHGFYGIADEHHWFLGKILDTTVVRIGRLEFERYQLENDINMSGYNYCHGTEVLNVHIPAGKSLEYQACKESYQLAAEYFQIENPVFVCESWLMSPILKKILPAGSNIIKFQSDFTEYEILWDDRQFEERVFGGKVLSCPEQYAQNTTLQKEARKILMDGGRLPSARGIKIGI